MKKNDQNHTKSCICKHKLQNFKKNVAAHFPVMQQARYGSSATSACTG